MVCPTPKWLLLFLTSLPVMLSINCGLLNSQLSGVLASVTVSPSPATVGLDKTVAFQAVGLDTTSNFMTITPTWTLSGAIGTIDASGKFTGTAEGTGTVTATASGMSGSSTVTVTSKGTISGVLKDTSKSPETGVRVSVQEFPAIFAVSAGQGIFSLPGIPAGRVTVSTEATGFFLTTTEAVTVGSGETTSLTMTLPPRLAVLSQVFNRNFSGEITSVSGSLTNLGSTTARTVNITYILGNFDSDTGRAQTSFGSGHPASSEVAAGQTSTFLIHLSPPLLSNFSQVIRRVSAEAF